VAYWLVINSENVIDAFGKWFLFMKRKIYDKLLDWKRNGAGRTALLIDGARRVGKSYIVEEFAKAEYKSR